MKKLFGFLLILTFLAAVNSQAGVLLVMDGTYLTDSMVSSSSNDSVKYGYTVGALFSISKTMWGGWSYSGSNSNEVKSSVTTDIAGSDTGPTFRWQFGRNKSFSVGLTYNIISRATFANGTVTEEWTGTSFAVQAGAMPEIKDGLRLGVTLNYFAATYDKKVVQNVESSASYSRNWLYPAISLSKEF